MDILGGLPWEISEKILVYLSGEELARCCRVSTKWRELASNNFLWRKLCFEEFPYEIEQLINTIPSGDVRKIDFKGCYAKGCRSRLKWLEHSDNPQLVVKCPVSFGVVGNGSILVVLTVDNNILVYSMSTDPPCLLQTVPPLLASEGADQFGPSCHIAKYTDRYIVVSIFYGMYPQFWFPCAYSWFVWQGGKLCYSHTVFPSESGGLAKTSKEEGVPEVRPPDPQSCIHLSLQCILEDTAVFQEEESKRMFLWSLERQFCMATIRNCELEPAVAFGHRGLVYVESPTCIRVYDLNGTLRRVIPHNVPFLSVDLVFNTRWLLSQRYNRSGLYVVACWQQRGTVDLIGAAPLRLKSPACLHPSLSALCYVNRTRQFVFEIVMVEIVHRQYLWRVNLGEDPGFSNLLGYRGILTVVTKKYLLYCAKSTNSCLLLLDLETGRIVRLSRYKESGRISLVSDKLLIVNNEPKEGDPDGSRKIYAFV